MSSELCWRKKYDNLPNRIIVKSPFFEKTITSYGIIAFCVKTKKWLIVQRKYSASYIIVMRGAYRNSHLQTLAETLTKQEIDTLLSIINGTKDLISVYQKMFGFLDEKQESYIKDRIYNKETIEILTRAKVNAPDEPEWLWPKGKPLRPGEDSLKCGIREFTEETGVSIDNRNVIFPLSFNESFLSISGKRYETKCWLCLFKEEVVLPDISSKQHEIEKSEWVTEEIVRKRFTSKGKINLLDEMKPLLKLYES